MIPHHELQRYHAFVPVLFWPVLWLNLARLWSTIALCRAQGRRGLGYRVLRNGTIMIVFMGDSEAERCARAPLGEDFDYTPWERLRPLDLGVLAALFGGDTAETPLAHPACTAHAPCLHQALAPP
jgi:hypothetical protein